MTSRSYHAIAYFDHVRALLTVLIIFHHCAIMFGAPGAWYLREPLTSSVLQAPLAFFTAVNQAFIPACVFLLAGYFTPAACARKGWGQFLRDRALRLGLPLLLYGFVLGPLTAALASRRDVVDVVELGPFWYLLALLLLSVIYALWRVLARRLKLRLRTPHTPGFTTLLLTALCAGGLAFLLRAAGPLLPPLPDLEAGSLLTACLLFVVGASLARSRWLERIHSADVRPWRIAALLLIPTLGLYTVWACIGNGLDAAYSGSLLALVFALCEPLLVWGLILDLLYRVRTTPKRGLRAPAWRWWSEAAYAACLIHPPVITALGLLLQDVPANNGIRFLIAGSAGTVFSFVLAREILRLPAARRIL
jgi:hypothetical protein